MSGVDLPQPLLPRLYALLCAVLLATACLQAVGPIGAPLERTQGSAFSAATDDVALAQVRRSEAARPAPALLAMPAAPVRAAVPSPAAAPAQPPLARPRSTGPPPYPWQPLQTGPRAPPLA